MIYLGIDPGITGAVAAIHEDGEIEFYDTPIVSVQSRKKTTNSLDPYACVALLRKFCSPYSYVAMEKVNAMPGIGAGGARVSIGATSAFNFGAGYGIWLGILAALDMRTQLISPPRWKKAMMEDMGKEKDASRVRARQMFPQAASSLDLKKHHGRADALLLAEYGRRNDLGKVSLSTVF
jgi:hypothetical protein